MDQLHLILNRPDDLCLLQERKALGCWVTLGVIRNQGDIL